MKCIWTDCDNDARAKSPYCGGTCKKRAQRLSGTEPAASGTNVPVEVGQEQVGQTEVVPVKRQLYLQVVDAKCYGRQAVVCNEFKTRPEPLDNTDQPVPCNRGRYIRSDGTVYQFDAGGHSFECKHEYKDRQGNTHLAVYETTADVQACYAVA